MQGLYRDQFINPEKEAAIEKEEAKYTDLSRTPDTDKVQEAGRDKEVQA